MHNAFVQKIVSFGKGMLEGFLSIRKLKNPGLFILSTIGIWVFYYFVSYVLFFCIPETSNLGPLAGLDIAGSRRNRHDGSDAGRDRRLSLVSR